VVVNKWDAIVKESQTMQNYVEHIRKELNFMAYVPIVFISAKNGQRVDEVLPMALRVQEERLARVPTSALNSLMQKAQDQHTPIYKTGEGLRIYYGTQVHTNPPTFMLYVNNPTMAHFSYIRFLENQIRKEFPFTGTPIRIVLKPRHD
jgi:GTP-binding protein